MLATRQSNTESPLSCTEYGRTGTCPTTYKKDHHRHHHHRDQQSSATCPDYFRWIHEDLRQWGLAGEGPEAGPLQAGDRRGKGLRGEVSEGVRDEGRFYAVGGRTVVTEVPWESA